MRRKSLLFARWRVQCLFGGVKSTPLLRLGAVLSIALVIAVPASARADTFGNGANTFTIDFVTVSDPGNPGDTNPVFPFLPAFGAVPYTYRIATYEISQAQRHAAVASGLQHMPAGYSDGNNPLPFTQIQWFVAASFVNWLNTSTGHQAAYDVTYQSGVEGGTWSMNLWSSRQAWTQGGTTNFYRNKDAYYFLPSEDEWYKAAYYNASATNYFLWPTASSDTPVAVTNGTAPGTAVYNPGGFPASWPAAANDAGGLSPYGTMAQGGNASEWIESSYDGANNNVNAKRTVRGGSWTESVDVLESFYRQEFAPNLSTDQNIGFRVASVPEPSTWALLALSAATLGVRALRRRG